MTRQILHDLIQQASRENLIRLFREKNHHFAPVIEDLAVYNDENFGNGFQLGVIDFSKDGRFVVCVFDASKELSERSGKKAQYDLAKKILREKIFDAGIFVFIGKNGNFRFSLVYAILHGTRQTWSNFRRFTYFVSPELTNKTFIQRISEGDFSSLESIKEAFSVERVTSKFFNEFREIFDRTRMEFEKQNKNTVCVWLKSKYDDEEYQEQVKKFTLNFLGRIIFLYFLLRKGWIEDRSDYIRKIMEDRSNKNLYLDVLKPLFFDVFARQPHERPPDVKAQYQNTPYLNGGLFEHSELETQMEKEGKFILFSDKFIRGIILDFFEAYNFTVDENSPDDQEVSIDPEMLGKVFENTLAEEERNQRGTFYTPREIVHFMVKDALSQFLCNETGISRTILDPIILNDGDVSGLSAHQIRQCDLKLESIKVLDPAVGSGAFPVEMMQVLIDLRKRLNVRVGVNINEVALKKDLIKNNLYGVDIDPGAIEVAKLRLWLALIVDYDKSLAEPLPNLDFQFRVGNSLQEKIDDIDIFNEAGAGQIDWLQSNREFEAIKAQMIDLKERFYLTSDEVVRNRLKDQFDSLESQLIHAVLEKYREQVLEQIQNQSLLNAEPRIAETTQKIDRLEQRIQDGTYKLFKPDFHFSEVFDRVDENGERVGGFDIVLGNPPYGVSIEKDIKDWHELNNYDSYGIFLSTALMRFLKPIGVMSYIVSDTWLTIKSHRALRKQVLDTDLHKVIRLHSDCFEANVNACIITTSKRKSNNQKIIAADLSNISTRYRVEELRDILYYLEQQINENNAKYAIYAYEQKEIFKNTNLPIFIGSSKLFKMMDDTNICKESDKKNVRKYVLNNSTYYLYHNNFQYLKLFAGVMGAKKYFASLEPKTNITHINENQIIKSYLSDKEKKNGISVSNPNEPHYVRFDKGGKTINKTNGNLINYYQKPEYYIKWDTKTVKKLKNNNQLRNLEQYFSKGILFSSAGVYSPVFRFSDFQVFEKGYHLINQKSFDDYFLLGLLCSKLAKYVFKSFINHTVNTNSEDIYSFPIIIPEPYNNERISEIVQSIIEKLQNDFNYDYLLEQREIDKIIYKIYGLNDVDITEVETWYARRYPRLAHLCDI